MEPNLTLLQHQQIAKDFIMTHPHCGLFLKMGLGKTRTTLDALYDLNPTHHVLVIAPKNIARSTWIDEINKWNYPFRYKSFIFNEKGKQLSRKKRLELYASISNEPPSIWFINRDLVVDLIDNMPTFHDPITGKLAPYWYFPTVIIDELQSFKSYNSERFKAMKKVRPYISRLIGLTGTPQPKGIEDLWAEIYLLDMGQRLGPNITSFRNAYEHSTMVINDHNVGWEPNIGAEDMIHDRIKDIVISMENSSMQIPDITYNYINVYMNDDEMKIYKKFKKDLVIDINGKEIIASNAAVLSGKLSQMASGAIYIGDKSKFKCNNCNKIVEDYDIPDICPYCGTSEFTTIEIAKKTFKYEVIHEHKLEMCEYIINNANDCVIIAYHFKSDKDMLMKYFAKKSVGIQCEAFDGSPEMIQRWNNKQIPVMLVQPASAGHGLNLQQGGHTLIWYTVPTSLEEYQQCNARLHRQGQKDIVIIHHLLTDGTIDRRLLANIERKDTSQQALYDAVKAEIDED